MAARCRAHRCQCVDHLSTLDELESHYESLRERIREEVKKRTRLLDEDDDTEADGDTTPFKHFRLRWVE